MTGAVTRNKHDMNLRIKKNAHYKDSSSGDPHSYVNQDGHTESTTYVRKGVMINKKYRVSAASENENCSDRREQARTNMRSAPIGKGTPHTTTKRNA